MNIEALLQHVECKSDGSDVTSGFEEEEMLRVMFDKNICDSVAAIINAENMTCQDLDICLSEDPSLISYIMYDNSLDILMGQKHGAESRNSPDSPDSRVLRIIKAFCCGSVMENLMYSKNDWLLSDICNLYRCGVAKGALQGMKVKAPLAYTTITTRASNYYNSVKRIGEQEAARGVSFEGIQRATEIEYRTGVALCKLTGTAGCGGGSCGPRKHKEDSAINNYVKRIIKSASKKDNYLHKEVVIYRAEKDGDEKPDTLEKQNLTNQ